jgi:methyl-accepting chemotaxis protein
MSDPVARSRRRFPVRWKLLAAFAAAFTIVFAFIAIWVVNYASDVALKRLTGELLQAAEGSARDLPKNAVAGVVALPDDADLDASRAYQRIDEDLDSIRATIPSVEPYMYAEADGRLVYLFGTDTFREPVAKTAPEQTLEYMRQGLQGTTFQPANTDAYGTWISAFSPVVDKQGDTIAVVGMDYSLEYVADVEREARAQVLPVLGISYALLVVLVLVVATLVVRPLRRLTSATRRIADGEYDLDLTGITRTRFPDEMTELADSFRVMADKVAARERALTKEVKRLQVEIDAGKREETVREITETDFFADLAAKADDLRSRIHRD